MTLKSTSEAARDLPQLAKPAVISVLADKITPVLAFERLRNYSQYAFLFESSETDSRLARFSILGSGPAETVQIVSGGINLISKKSPDAGSDEASTRFIATDDPLAFLAERTQLLGKSAANLELSAEIPFAAGYVGYLSYGATKYFDGIEQQKSDPLAVPDGMFSFYDSIIVFDHKERQMRIVSFRGEAHCRELLQQLETKGANGGLAAFARPALDAFEKVQASMPREKFIELVKQCQEFIAEGQVFQIVLAQRFARPYEGDPFRIYRALQSINPSPYGYFLQFPEFAYLGASPERLLACRQGKLSLTALAGTRPRGQNEEEENALEQDLRSSEKELAEHYMLVDLGRNDLGRIGQIGSVSCGEIARVIRYGQVMHLSTDISAQLAAGKTCFDAVRSCFPAGTVSGAPKIRAMELLAKLEPEKRGIYSGLVGYFDIHGNTDSAIAIRSALVKNKVAHVSAGAGIVQDSQPEAEYEETRNKALSVLKAISIAEQMGA